MNVQMAKQIGLSLEQAVKAEEIACCTESIAGHLIKYVASLENEIANLKNMLSLIGRRVRIQDKTNILYDCAGRVVNISPLGGEMLVDFGPGVGLKYVCGNTNCGLESE